MYLSPITGDKIIKAVAAMLIKHSSGFDSISVRLLKITITSIVKLLCLIFNKSFLTGQVPTYLKIVKICLIFKSGDKNDMTNYKSIGNICSAYTV